MQAPFRFLSNAEFLALGVQGKAQYLVRAHQELEKQKEILTSYRENLAVQIAAMVELGGMPNYSSGSRT